MLKLNPAGICLRSVSQFAEMSIALLARERRPGEDHNALLIIGSALTFIDRRRFIQRIRIAHQFSWTEKCWYSFERIALWF